MYIYMFEDHNTIILQWFHNTYGFHSSFQFTKCIPIQSLLCLASKSKTGQETNGETPGDQLQFSVSRCPSLADFPQSLSPNKAFFLPYIYILRLQLIKLSDTLMGNVVTGNKIICSFTCDICKGHVGKDVLTCCLEPVQCSSNVRGSAPPLVLAFENLGYIQVQNKPKPTKSCKMGLLVCSSLCMIVGASQVAHWQRTCLPIQKTQETWV